MNKIFRRYPSGRSLISLIAVFLLAACSTSEPVTDPPADTRAENRVDLTSLERPVPNPIEIPSDYLSAVSEGSRSQTGEPGPDYWQNRASYDLQAELFPEEYRIEGHVTIQYENHSPDDLDRLILELSQNLHKEGTMRKDPTEVTGGVEIESVRVRGSQVDEFPEEGPQQRREGYLVDATRMLILLDEPLEAGGEIELELSWSFQVPQQGAGGRMGHSRDNLFYIAYWYPQVAVYDDVIGWFIDPFLGNAEFYHGFADYSLEVTLPDNWLVMATGEFLNPGEVLSETVYERYRQALDSDEAVTIVAESDLGVATKRSSDGRHTWRFESSQVRDVAFKATRESVWEGARAPIGDLTGDGETDYTAVHSFYRREAPLWEDLIDYARHSISFLSDYLQMPYPWPHMTSVEGADIIGGGMEFPMITIMGDYNRFGEQRLHGVTAHEFAHMWIPMILSTNERRFMWVDEGFTTYNTHHTMADRYPDHYDNSELFRQYLGIAGTDLEGPIMRRSDYHYPGPAFGIASYPKPASILKALKGVIGEETFHEAYHTFLQEWAWKHPYPWDFFRTVERVSGQDLEWFWRSWYYETWVLNQTIGEVEQSDGEVTVEIVDRGEIPMPTIIQIGLEDGTRIREEIPVDVWLQGSRRHKITVETDSPVMDILIDPDNLFPDVDRRAGRWHR